MKILSIDTSSSICSVCLLDNNILLKELCIDDDKTHSQKLMPMIKNLLEDLNISIKDIDILSCNKGPGSFTGIRIGISTIKALADVCKCKAIGVSSLEGLAYNVKNYTGLICCLIDARNENVYFGLFDVNNSNYSLLIDYRADNINEIIQLLTPYTSPIKFVGNGALLHKDKLQKTFPTALFEEGNVNKANSVSIGLAALDKLNNNLDSSLSPLYLRKSQAERMLEEKNK